MLSDRTNASDTGIDNEAGDEDDHDIAVLALSAPPAKPVSGANPSTPAPPAGPLPATGSDSWALRDSNPRPPPCKGGALAS